MASIGFRLRFVFRMELSSFGFAEAFGESEKDASDEAANVSPESSPAVLMSAGAVGIQGIESAGELDNEPPNEQDEGGNAYAKPPPDQAGEDAAMRKEQAKRGHDSGNRSAGANAGKVGVQGKQGLGQGSSEAASEVKAGVGKMAEVVFHVAPEDPEKPHIADDVKKTGVKEHGSENGEEWAE